MSEENTTNWSCPTGLGDYTHIQLAHGSGGKMMHDLIENLFLPAFNNSFSKERHDCVYLPIGKSTLAFTTDSYVVDPLFFPGGDIGSLAINGTINDLAMGGARPLYLSAGFIIEEGLSFEVINAIVQSMKVACENSDVHLVTGDTKVVDKGKGDGLFINTAGIGIVEHAKTISPKRVREGDAVLLSGDIGRHGIAVMAKRQGLEFQTDIESDCCSLSVMVSDLINEGVDIHCLRDCTRGGLATSLVEIAEASGLSIEISEAAVPISEGVRGACEILGLDPLYVANEGCFVAFVAPDKADLVVTVLQKHSAGTQAGIIGKVTNELPGQVILKSIIGTQRIVHMLTGEQLPRIC